MRLECNVIDLDRVLKSLEGLTKIEKDRVIQGGLKNAASIFVNSGRKRLQERMKNKKGVTGNLIKSLKARVKKSKLGVLAGFNGYGAHAHLIDLGTAKRATKKKGANRGKVTGNNFWTETIAINQGNAMNKVYEGIERGIKRIIMRG